jgi:hypothetical protein
MSRVASLSRVLVLLCLALTAACGGGPTSPGTPVRTTFVLAPCDTVNIPGTSTSLRFAGVEGDSRCPADAMCITGGDAVVVLEVLSGHLGLRAELHTGNLRPATVGELTFTLEGLAPYPFSSRTIEPGDYRATITVTR